MCSANFMAICWLDLDISYVQGHTSHSLSHHSLNQDVVQMTSCSFEIYIKWDALKWFSMIFGNLQYEIHCGAYISHNATNNKVIFSDSTKLFQSQKKLLYNCFHSLSSNTHDTPTDLYVWNWRSFPLRVVNAKLVLAAASLVGCITLGFLSMILE